MIADSHSPSTKQCFVPSILANLSNFHARMRLLFDQKGMPIKGPGIKQSKIKKNLQTKETLSRWIAPGFFWKIKTRHRVDQQEGIFHKNQLLECESVSMVRRSLSDILPEAIESLIAPMGSLEPLIGSFRMSWRQQKLNIGSELSMQTKRLLPRLR